MECEVDDRIVLVTLSARNVKALYHKLTMAGSTRTLTKPMLDGRTLIITIQHDPGPMHPLTEAALRCV